MVGDVAVVIIDGGVVVTDGAVVVDTFTLHHYNCIGMIALSLTCHVGSDID